MDKILEYIASSANSGEFWHLCYMAIALHILVSIAIAFSGLGKVTVVRNADSPAKDNIAGAAIVNILPHLLYVSTFTAAAIVLSSISSRVDEDSIFYYYLPAIYIVYLALLVVIEALVRLFQYKINGYVDVKQYPTGTGGGMFSSLIISLVRADRLLNLMLRIIAKIILLYREASRSSESDRHGTEENTYVRALIDLQSNIEKVMRDIRRVTDEANRLHRAMPKNKVKDGKITYIYSWGRRRMSS